MHTPSERSNTPKKQNCITDWGPKMRSFVIVTAILTLAGCGDGSPDDRATDKAATEITSTTAKLAERDMIRVCKAGLAFRVGQKVEIIDAKVIQDQQVRLAHTRNDGKSFEYDCSVQGDVLRFRMIDEARPGTGPGIWSGNGSTTTFKLNPNSVDLIDTFNDGSNITETIAI